MHSHLHTPAHIPIEWVDRQYIWLQNAIVAQQSSQTTEIAASGCHERQNQVCDQSCSGQGFPERRSQTGCADLDNASITLSSQGKTNVLPLCPAASARFLAPLEGARGSKEKAFWEGVWGNAFGLWQKGSPTV